MSRDLKQIHHSLLDSNFSFSTTQQLKHKQSPRKGYNENISLLYNSSRKKEPNSVLEEPNFFTGFKSHSKGMQKDATRRLRSIKDRVNRLSGSTSKLLDDYNTRDLTTNSKKEARASAIFVPRALNSILVNTSRDGRSEDNNIDSHRLDDKKSFLTKVRRNFKNEVEKIGGKSSRKMGPFLIGASSVKKSSHYFTQRNSNKPLDSFDLTGGSVTGNNHSILNNSVTHNLPKNRLKLGVGNLGNLCEMLKNKGRKLSQKDSSIGSIRTNRVIPNEIEKLESLSKASYSVDQ